MSEEEIIKNIEDMLLHAEINLLDYEALAIQGLLDLYNKEKEKNKPKLLYNAKTNTFTSIKALDNNFIEKSKIKELINKRGNNGYTSLDCIDDIEKLLEE